MAAGNLTSNGTSGDQQLFCDPCAKNFDAKESFLSHMAENHPELIIKARHMTANDSLNSGAESDTADLYIDADDESGTGEMIFATIFLKTMFSWQYSMKLLSLNLKYYIYGFSRWNNHGTSFYGER